METDVPRPSRRQANDERLRDAALAEVVDHGADSLGPTAVARRAGLSTGAVYSRFEDTTELLVDLWEHRCQQAATELVDLAMNALLGQGGPAERRQLVAALSDPSPAIAAALELVVASRRDESLGEVVIPSGAAMLAHHAVTRSSDPDRRAKTALVVSLLLGLLLLDAAGVRSPTVPIKADGSVDPDAVPDVDPDAVPDVDPDAGDFTDWEGTFDQVAVLLSQTVDPPGVPPKLVLPELPSLDEIDADPTRAALVVACMEVIGRVGLQRATVTRIARRAGLTHGAIYGLFDSKEEMVAAAVAELTDVVLQRDRRFIQMHLEHSGDFAATVSAILAGFADGRRSGWRLFRLECHLAQRHDRALASALNAAYSRFMAHDAVTFTQRFGIDMALARGRARLMVAVPLGRILLQALAPGAMDEVDWRRSVGMLG